MAEWHTVESARDQWADAPFDEDGGDDTLTELLVVARGAVLAFAPALDGTFIVEDGIIVSVDDDTIPTAWRAAQLVKARIQWSAEKQPQGTFDDGDYDLSTYSLERQFKQLLRPKRGRPVIA